MEGHPTIPRGPSKCTNAPPQPSSVPKSHLPLYKRYLKLTDVYNKTLVKARELEMTWAREKSDRKHLDQRNADLRDKQKELIFGTQWAQREKDKFEKQATYFRSLLEKHGIKLEPPPRPDAPDVGDAMVVYSGKD
jgi:hypothetical protein